jgi:methanogenic corrinoid protein MtbC1
LHPSPRTDLAQLRSRFLSAQLSGNRREALRLVVEEGVQRGLSIEDVQLRIVQEAQREIGRLWQENLISVAQEHMATAIAQLTLAHVYQYAPVPAAVGKQVWVACVEGELHDFPARLVTDALELAGFETRFLGANVPTDSLLAMLRQERPDLLALSVTMSFNVGSARTLVRRVRSELSNPPPIALGGHACNWAKGLAEELEVDGCGADASELVAFAGRLLGVRQ